MDFDVKYWKNVLYPCLKSFFRDYIVPEILTGKIRSEINRGMGQSTSKSDDNITTSHAASNNDNTTSQSTSDNDDRVLDFDDEDCLCLSTGV